jgi:hypothetical protein
VPHVSTQHDRHKGAVLGNGHCVALVREAAGLPPTANWRRGELVRGSGAVPGTAIATFSADGRYENDTSGRSHAAILLEETPSGLRVLDQWVGQPVHERVIRFKGHQGMWVDDGDRYHVIEVA